MNGLQIRFSTLYIGSLNWKTLEICDELWKRNRDL